MASLGNDQAAARGGSCWELPQHKGFKSYSFLLEQELKFFFFFTFPVQYNLFQLPESLFFFPHRLPFAFSSCSNPNNHPTTQLSHLLSSCKRGSVPGETASAIKRQQLGFPTEKLDVAPVASQLQSISTF